MPPATDLYAHFRIVCGMTPRGFTHLPCLLARAWPDGRFELLSPAWERLGYPLSELVGRHICGLIALPPDRARRIMSALVTEGGSFDIALRCKDGRKMKYRWIRQFDDFCTSIFIGGDEMPAPRPMRAVVLNAEFRA